MALLDCHMIEYDNPLSYLRQVKGAPLSILVALSAASQPVQAKWLSSMTGYSPHSITSALVLLSEMQLVSCNTHRTAWRLTNGVRQLPLAPAQIPDRENRDPNSTTTAFKLYYNEEENNQKAAAEALTNPDRENRDPKIVSALNNVGIMEPTATILSELAWMTLEYAEAHISQAKRNNDPTGLLIHRMRSHDPQPPKYLDPDSEEARRKWSLYQGKCVTCRVEPCECDEP